jgi:ribonuclease P protein component
VLVATLATGPDDSALIEGLEGVHDEGFGRARRLRYERHLRILFADGRKLRLGPLTVVYYSPSPADLPISRRADAPIPEFPILAAVSVPKRQHRRSTQRARIKRLLRESYRRQVLPLLRTKLAAPLWLCWIWQDRRVPTQQEINDRLSAAAVELLKRLAPPSAQDETKH